MTLETKFNESGTITLSSSNFSLEVTHNDKGVAVIPLTINTNVGAIKVTIKHVPNPNATNYDYFPVSGKCDLLPTSMKIMIQDYHKESYL